jgi:hypothetical protein
MFMQKPFLDALAGHLDRTGKSLRDVCTGPGVSYEQLKRALQRNKDKPASTNADDAIRVAAYFGMTLNEFVGDDLAQDRAEVAATYSQPTDQERNLLKATGRGLAAPAREEG